VCSFLSPEVWTWRVYPFLNARMSDCMASIQSGIGMNKNAVVEPVRYQNKGIQSCTVMLWYWTEVQDARMPMPAVSTSMLMPSYETPAGSKGLGLIHWMLAGQKLIKGIVDLPPLPRRLRLWRITHPEEGENLGTNGYSEVRQDMEIFVLQASWAIGQWLNYQQIIRYCMNNLLLHHKSSIALPHIYSKQLVAVKDSFFGHLCILSIQEQRLCSCNSAGWLEQPTLCPFFFQYWPGHCGLKIILTFA
jgi:hypothetical protein